MQLFPKLVEMYKEQNNTKSPKADDIFDIVTATQADYTCAAAVTCGKGVQARLTVGGPSGHSRYDALRQLLGTTEILMNLELSAGKEVKRGVANSSFVGELLEAELL